MPTNFKRKNIRLHAPNYIGKRDYFVTICCHKRATLLAEKENAALILSHLQSSAAEYAFIVHASCAMPDHLHILAGGASDISNLLHFVNSFKQHTAYEFHERTGKQLWQYKFYDHILRSAGAVEDIALYIWMNPVRKGLCANPGDYPYSTSFLNVKHLHNPAAKPWIPPWKKKLL
jgi:putative transposase